MQWNPRKISLKRSEAALDQTRLKFGTYLVSHVHTQNRVAEIINRLELIGHGLLKLSDLGLKYLVF